MLSMVCSGCSQNEESSVTPDVPMADTADSTADEAAVGEGGLKALGLDPLLFGIDPDVNNDVDDAVGFQLEMPQEGDTIAVIHTSEGDITLRFFSELVPKTVTNFINLAEDGKYNNTTFHRVINDFVIQGGHVGSDTEQPNGISSYGQPFEDEFCDKLFNIRGAVAMANNGKDSNGSQFFINQINADKFQENGGWAFYDGIWKDTVAQLKKYKDNSTLLSAYIEENGDRFIDTDTVPNEVKKLYIENGGNPNLDGAYNVADRGSTVFAQVIDGMDVVDKIAAAEVNHKNVPKESIKINSIEITSYSTQAQTKSSDAAEETEATEKTD